MCKIQGSIIMFGLCASMLWGLMIGMQYSSLSSLSLLFFTQSPLHPLTLFLTTQTPSMLSSATHPLPICILELINAIVGVHLFLVLYKEMELEDIRKYRYVFHAIAWGYPLFACLLPLFKDKYPLFSSLFSLLSSLCSLLLLSTFTSHPLSLPKFSEITFNV